MARFLRVRLFSFTMLCFALLATGPSLMGPLEGHRARASAATAATSSDRDLDVENYMAAFGVTRDEAERVLALQPAAARTSGKLVASVGDDLARVRLVHTPKFSILLSVVEGANLEAATAVIEESPVPVQVRTVPTARLSTLLKLTELYLGDWKKRFAAIEASEIDGETGTIALEARGVSDARAAEIAELINGEYDLPGSTVTVRPIAFPTGTLMRRGGYDMNGCTTGFSVRPAEGSGAWGMLTAAHCFSANQWWRFWASNTNEPVYPQTGIKDGSADIRWFKIDLTPLGYFFGTSTTSAQPVEGRLDRSEMDGVYTCHRGNSTGYSCGYVSTITYGPANLCGAYTCANTWPRVDDLAGVNFRCFNGDSGGPVVYATLAMGLLMGGSSSGSSSGDCNWYVFTPVGRMLDLGRRLVLAD